MNLRQEEKTKYLKKTFELENIDISINEIMNIIKMTKRKEIKMTKTEQKYQNWEDYLIEGTNTLKNIPNIIDKEQLQKYEKKITSARLSELYDDPITGDFDIDHLYSIHKYLFQEIYEWAGETRTIAMMKQTVFLEPNKIEPFVSNTLTEINNEIKQIKNEYELAICISTLFYNLIFAHPFREGNGRTIREFIRQLIESIDFEFGKYQIDYSKINQQNIGMGIMCGTPMFITPEFQKSLTKKL